MPFSLNLRALVAGVASVAVLLAILSLYAFSPQVETTTQRELSLPLDTVAVNWDDVVIPVHSQGHVRAAHALPLIMEVSGRIIEVAPGFADGGQVHAGEVLLVLDPEPFELDVVSQQNAVQAAHLHLMETRARARVAGSSKRSALGRFEPQLNEARSRLAAAQARLRQVERNVEQSVLVAGLDGRLRSINVVSGQHVSAGTVLGSLYQEDVVEVRLPVRDEWLALLGIVPGDERTLEPVTVNLTGRFAGREGQWQGRVVRREGGLNRNQMMTLIVQVDNQAHKLPLEPGVLVQAELRGAPTPAIAVMPRGAQAGDNEVWVLDDDDRLRRQAVDVLHHDSNYLYLQDGVRTTTRVALAGDLQLLEGMHITPRAVPNHLPDEPVTQAVASASRRKEAAPHDASENEL